MFDSEAHSRELFALVDENGQNPWNLPDWKDASQYPKGGEVLDGDWRWEFIRRHSDYRKAWLVHQDERCSISCSISCRSSCRKRFASRGAELEASRFGLTLLYSPACRYDVFRRSPCWTPYYHPAMRNRLFEIMPAFRNSRSVEEFCDRASKTGKYLIAITPTESLNAQWSQIKQGIIELNEDFYDGMQPKKRKWDSKNFQRYLRVIDAKDDTSSQKASWEEIAEAFRRELQTKAATKDTVRGYFLQALDTQAKFLETMPA